MVAADKVGEYQAGVVAGVGWVERGETVDGFSLRSTHPTRIMPAQLILDMNADNLIERCLGAESERGRAARVEILRPTGDDFRDRLVWLAANASRDIVAG